MYTSSEDEKAAHGKPAEGQRDSDGSPTDGPNDIKQSSQAGQENEESSSYYFTAIDKKTKRLPAWLNHFKAEELKLLVKAAAAVWIMTILIFIDPARQAIGQATFFGSIVLFFVPPVGVVLVQLLGGLTIIIGACLGWAWGTITMEAALATRPAADVAARYKELQQLANQTIPNATPAATAAYISNAIAMGYMLDPRVTATYFCMMALFVYLVARIRIAAPKLALVSIFALIISDVYLTSGPLLPSFNGTLPSLFVYPVGISVAVGLLCNILIFPQSTSSIVRIGIRDTVTPMKSFSDALLYHFANPSSRIVVERITEVQAKVVEAFQSTEAAKSFLAIDFTTGRWSPEDIASLSKPVREVVIAFSQLLQYQKQREEHRTKKDSLAKFTQDLHTEGQEKQRLRVAHHQVSRAVGLYENMQHPEAQALIEKTLKILAQPSKDMFDKVNMGIDAIVEALAVSNNRKQLRKSDESHLQTLELLGKAQTDFMERVTSAIMGTHSDLFDDEGYLIQDGDGSRPPPVTGLIVGILFQENISNLATAVAALLQRITELEQKRHDRHFWPPRGLRRILAWSLDRETVPTAMQNPASIRKHPAEPQKEKGKRWRGKKQGDTEKTATVPTAEAKLKAMRKPSSRHRHATSRLLVATIEWLTNTEGLYALRVLVVTIALTIPAAIPSSAAFYRRETALWAAIMGQLGLVPYAADFVYGSLMRTAGTAVGGVIGTACWYIGAGSGSGNPYGMAAIMALAIVCFMWLRLFLDAKHLQTVVIMVATAYLVVSYSWVDERTAANGGIGTGYTVFWRRLLLVLIGIGAAAIVTFFPRPPSGSIHCRRVLAGCLGSIKDRYTLCFATWRNPPTDFRTTIEKEVITSEETFAAINPQVNQLQFEFSTSNFDSRTLSRVSHLCGQLNRSMTRMLLCLPHLEPESRTRFMENSGAASETVTMELITALTLIQQVLVSGDPLPALMSTPLIQRSLVVFNQEKKPEPLIQLHRAQLIDNNGRKYLSAVSAFVQFLFTIDELVIEVKKAVGETGDVDLER